VAGGTFAIATANNVTTNFKGGFSLNNGNGGNTLETSQVDVTGGGTLSVGSSTPAR